MAQQRNYKTVVGGRFVIHSLWRVGGIWYSRVRDKHTGRATKFSTRQKSRRKAEQAAFDYCEAQVNREQERVAGAGFEAAFEEFIGLKTVGAGQRRNLESALRVMAPEFEGTLVHEIEPRQIERFLKRLKDRGRAARTLHFYLTQLRAFFRWGRRNQMCSGDPTEGIRTPRQPKRGGIALEFDEARRLLAACRSPIVKDVKYPNRQGSRQTWQPPPHLYLAVLISLYTGLRRGNAISLRWSDLNLDKRQISIPAERMKADAALVIPIHRVLVKALRARLKGQNKIEPEGRVLGVELREITKSFKSALQRGDLAPMRWHDLRHTFATWMSSRCSHAALQQLLGHSPGAVTFRYVHVPFGELRDAVDQLPGLVAESSAAAAAVL